MRFLFKLRYKIHEELIKLVKFQKINLLIFLAFQIIVVDDGSRDRTSGFPMNMDIIYSLFSRWGTRLPTQSPHIQTARKPGRTLCTQTPAKLRQGRSRTRRSSLRPGPAHSVCGCGRRHHILGLWEAGEENAHSLQWGGKHGERAHWLDTSRGGGRLTSPFRARCNCAAVIFPNCSHVWFPCLGTMWLLCTFCLFKLRFGCLRFAQSRTPNVGSNCSGFFI